MATHEQIIEELVALPTKEELEKALRVSGAAEPFANHIRDLWDVEHGEEALPEPTVDAKVNTVREEKKPEIIRKIVDVPDFLKG